MLTPRKKIASSTFGLLKYDPFFAIPVLSMEMVEAGGDILKGHGLGTDGVHCFYKPDFIAQFSEREVMFMLAHEAAHNMFGHFERNMGRDKEKWNIATDYAINNILKEECQRTQMKVPSKNGEPICYIDENYRGMRAEEIYSLLSDSEVKKIIKRNINFDMHPNQQQKNKSGINKSGKSKSGKSKSGKSKSSKSKSGPFEYKGDKNKWKTILAKSIITSKMKGMLPGGIDSYVKELFHPKVEWNIKLKEYMIDTLTKDDYTLIPPNNRRFMADGFIFPSLKGEGLGIIAVAIDDSGSITDEDLKIFASEAQGILDAYDTEMHLIIGDTESTDYQILRKGDLVPTKYKGRGGTDFKHVFNLIEEKGINPTFLIFLTDGEGDYPKYQPSYPVFWVIKGDYNNIPFGQIIRIEPNY